MKGGKKRGRRGKRGGGEEERRRGGVFKEILQDNHFMIFWRFSQIRRDYWR